MSRILYSKAAQTDRRSITAYTVEHFGFGQARRLQARLEKVLLALADSPQIGSSRRELDPPGQSFRYYVVMKSFLVVYRPSDTGIEVARILHVARDLSTEIERDPGEELTDESS